MLALDWRADEGAPLGPRAVVVADIGVAEELRQHEPGVRAALADAAVGDDRLVRGDPPAAVDLAQLVGALEGAVRVGGGGPGDVLRGRDVASALRALLRVVRHVDDLAAVLVRG